MTNTIAPVTGWILDKIVHLDDHRPGFAAAYFRASAERRQVIAAYLSQLPRHAGHSSSTADLLARADHKTILREAFIEVPPGLRGALRRSGAQPHQRHFYTLLHKMLCFPTTSNVVAAIRQSEVIDTDFLMTLRKLPAAVCAPNVANAVGSVSGAHDLSIVLGLLINHGVDGAALMNAVRDVTDRRALAHCLKRWTMKVRMPPHPVPKSIHYKPFANAADLARAALRYQNCMKQYLVDALNGYHAFAEVTLVAGQRGAVVHLQRYDAKWVAQGIFGPRNSPPRRELREIALAHLRQHGVEEHRRHPSREGPWSALARLRMSGFYDFGF